MFWTLPISIVVSSRFLTTLGWLVTAEDGRVGTSVLELLVATDVKVCWQVRLHL